MDATAPTGEIVVTLASTDKHYPYDRLSITFDSTDQEILDALAPVLLEEEGFDIHEEQEEGYYTFKRYEDSKMIYIFPKSTAGKWLFKIIRFVSGD